MPDSDGADHGGADDEFATVVFDEAFVRCAAVHEPSARERQLAAAEARFEPDTVALGRSYEVTGADGLPLELRPHPSGLDDDRLYSDPWSGRRRPRWGRAARYEAVRHGGHRVAQQRWHRPVALVLALVMGVSLVAVAVAAIYRGVGGGAAESPRRPESGASSTGSQSSPSASPVVLLPG
ncbi:hypothetical protein GCM10009760_53450 [Kitasatospora kazusensis]|uniref:Uncharacterized protein n=1 Tax=Kitasatospora kazusensis TaxID=407974 RepID=A0ABN3A5V5_9ACTN